MTELREQPTAELLERFRRGADLLSAAIEGGAAAELDFTARPGDWSIRQIAAHLADSEVVCAVRFRRVVAEERPKLDAWDQEAWAARLDYARREPLQSAETFRRIRGENYDLLKHLPEEMFERTGVHSERGELSLRQLLAMFAAHAENHAAQVRARRGQFAAQRGESVE